MNKRFTEKFTIMKFWLVEKNHTTITWLENNNNLMTHFLGKTPNALNTSSRFSENVTLCSLAYEQESPILEPDLVRPPRWNVRCWVVLNANQAPLTISRSCISSMLSVLLLLKPRQSSAATKWRYFLHFLVWISKHFSRLVISSRPIWFVVWFLAFRFSQNWKEIIRIRGKQIDHKPFNPLCQTIARRHVPVVRRLSQ